MQIQREFDPNVMENLNQIIRNLSNKPNWITVCPTFSQGEYFIKVVVPKKRF